MAQIPTVALTDTFDSWRIRTNSVTDRINQFAVNESKLYANVVTANAMLNAATANVEGRLDVTGNIRVGNNLIALGNTTLGGSGKTITTTGTFTHTGLFDLTGGAIVSANLDIADSSYINIGDSDDLQLYHNGTNSYVIDAGAGNLFIGADSDVKITNAAGTENKAVFSTDGAVTLYHDNGARLATTASGVSITGGAVISANLDIADSSYINIGNSDDLQIYHDGSHSYIKDSGTGSLRLRGTDLRLESSTLAHNFILCTEGGAVTAYYNDSPKISTTSTGVDVTGEMQSDSLDVDGDSDLSGSLIFSGSSKSLTLNNNMLDEFSEYLANISDSTASVTVDASDNVQQYTLTAATVDFNLPALSTYPSTSIKTITIIVKQDVSGSRAVDITSAVSDTIAFNNSSTCPQPTTTAASVSMYTCLGVVQMGTWFVSLSYIDD